MMSWGRQASLKTKLFVLMALRPYDKKNQLPKNTIVIDDKAFYKLVGPTVLNVIKSFEVMVRRRKTPKEENKIQKRTRCEAMVVSTGIQCQKPAVDGNPIAIYTRNIQNE